MRVIYATSDLEAWIHVAKNMQTYEGWEPIYWITTPKNNQMIHDTFPSTIRQDYIDAVRGVYTPIEKVDVQKVIDAAILRQYAYYEKIALKMMDRMDPTAYSFNLSEREDLYYDFLAYWINNIDELKPDIVLFTESPHALFQYILYAVCVENNIKVLRFTPTHIEGLCFLSSSIEETPSYLTEVYEAFLETPPTDSYDIVDRYLIKNRKNYDEALPYYMKNLTQKKSFTTLFKNYIDKLKRFLLNPTFATYKKGSRYSLSDNNITKIDLLTYKLRGFLKKKQLKREYDSLAVSADLTASYIYVALHYQPEKTTSPEGGVFVDQWLMIFMLSAHVPKGWKIYVKEHIAQFSEKLYGEQGRQSDFYRKVSALDNVDLITSSRDSFELIDKAKAVATVTGTVGLESVIRSVPVLSFGYAWYAICHGVFTVKTAQELKFALMKIERGYRVDRRKVDHFLYSIENVSFPCYLNPGNKVGVDFDEQTNIENLTQCLRSYAFKV